MTAVVMQLEQLRDTISEIDALSALILDAFDDADWRGASRVLVERTVYIIGIIARTAADASSRLDSLQAAVADAQPATAGERWEGEGTASGEPDMSAHDAEIVRRIREQCPDSRYDGGSDEELILLFKRNKQVLSRSDEDVIAAMVHPR